jgi:hypothetical protein
MGGRPSLDSGRGSNDGNVLAVVVAGVADPGAAVSARGYRFEALSSPKREGASLERGTTKSHRRAMAAKRKSHDLRI